MAKSRIENKDIVQDNFLVDPKKNTEDFIKVLGILKNEATELLKTFKITVEGLKDTDKSVKAINKVEQAITGVNEVEQELLKLTNQEKVLAKQLIEIKEAELKNISNISKGITAENKARKEGLIVEKQAEILKKEELKTSQQLEKNKQEEVKTEKQIFSLRVQKVKEDERLNKIKEKEEKLSKEQNSIYVQQSKRLVELRAKYKDLRLELGKNDDAVKELGNELSDLDATLKEVDAEAGQFNRNVGNYPKTTENAKKGFSSLSGFLLGTMVSSFTKSRETSREFQIVLEQIGSVSRTVVAGLVEFFKNKLFPTIENLGLKLQKTGLEVKLFGEEMKAIFSDEAEQNVIRLEKSINDLSNRIVDNNKKIAASKNPLSPEELKKSLDATKENIIAIRELAIAEAKLSDQRELLTKDIALLNIEQEKAALLAEDDTLSLQNQQLALAESLKLRQKSLDLERQLAEKQLELAIKRINVNFKEQGLGAQINRQNVEKLEFLKDFNTADKLQDENITNLVESVKNLQAVEGARAIAKIENSEKERRIDRDLFEQRLDFAIDVFDRQKAVNERIIGLEKTTLQERGKLIKETEVLLEKSFDSQIKLTENFIARSLKSQGRSEQEVADALQRINLRKLTELKDEAEVRRQLIDAGIADEITQNRIREIIIERKSFVQDLADLQTDLSKEFFDQETALLTQRREINAQIAAEETEAKVSAFEESEKFNQQLFNDAKRQLETEKDVKLELIELEEDLADQVANSESEKTRIREEANEKRRQLEKETIEQIEDLEKTANEKSIENRKETYEAINQLLDQFAEVQREKFEERISLIDNEIEASKNREEQIRQISQKGIVDADKSLAVEQRKQAELEAEKEKEIKRQEARELGFTALKTYTAKVESGDPTPLISTVKDITLLLAAIKGLSAFYEGSERVGDDLNPVLNTKRDAHIIRVDGDEKIFKPSHARRIGFNISNEKVVQLVEQDRRKKMSETISSKLVPVPYESNEQMISRLEQVVHSINELPNKMPNLVDQYIDHDTKEMVYIIKKELDTFEKRRKLGRSFG